VFLMDFFLDSECDAEWLAVAHAAVLRLHGSKPNAAAFERTHCVPFDPRLHGRLLLELQLLYVALGRGRRRAFIFDRDMDKRGPMFEYLSSRVAENDGWHPPVAVFDDTPRRAQDEGALSDDDSELSSSTAGSGALSGAASGRLLGVSTASDWQTTGAAMLANGLYEQAARAFFTAGNMDGGWRATGRALVLAAEAADVAAGQEVKCRALYLQAAHAYARGNAYGDAKACLLAAGEAALVVEVEAAASQQD
jgi:hypothetical protein